MLKNVDTSEVVRGPHDAPGHWLVTAAKLVTEVSLSNNNNSIFPLSSPPPPLYTKNIISMELVLQYLKRKVFSCPLPASIIPELHVCKSDPWDLPGDLEQERYFFSTKVAKYPNGNRSNRATNSGYWKATGLDKQIVTSKGNNQVFEMNKTLVFCRGKPPYGSRTDWIMHEYRLILNGSQSKSERSCREPHDVDDDLDADDRKSERETVTANVPLVVTGARERDEERKDMDKDRKRRDRDKDRIDRDRDREHERREKDRERERERAKRERSTRSRSRSERDRDRERDFDMRDARRFRDKKEVAEPEADPARDQRTVFAYQMPLKATETDVYEFFSKAGKNLVQSNASSGAAGVTGPYGAVDRKLYVGNLHFNMTES
ncbi:NAC domain-containing protein 83 [Glycine soja]